MTTRPHGERFDAEVEAAALNGPDEEPTAISERAHIFATDGFEAVLFPSGVVLMQGDNVIRLTPAEGLAIAGAIQLMAGPDMTEAAPESD